MTVDLTVSQVETLARHVGFSFRVVGANAFEVATRNIRVQCWTDAQVCRVVGHVSPWHSGGLHEAVALAVTKPALLSRRLRVQKLMASERREARVEVERRARRGDGEMVCCDCGRPIWGDEWTLDHLIPRSRGGSNDIENLGPCHKGCNDRRGDSMEEIEGMDVELRWQLRELEQDSAVEKKE